MAGAIKHMERSHRATALKKLSRYAVAAVKQQRKMTLGQKLKSALKRDTRKES